MATDTAIQSKAGSNNLHRTANDLEGDLQAAAKRYREEIYNDWPNQAGFTGLDEVRGPVELTVTGTIPSWAAGVLYRTGPGQSEIQGTPKGTHKISHWFDGLAHSHRFEIIAAESKDSSPVRVFYSSRRQAEASAADLRKYGVRRNMTFGQRQDPCVGIFGKMMGVYRKKLPNAEMRQLENICVAVIVNPPTNEIDMMVEQANPAIKPGQSKKHLWQTTDASMTLQVDATTMEPVGRLNNKTLNSLLDGPSSCAHAERCPKSGDLYNINTQMGRSGAFKVFCTKAGSGETKILATISRPDVPPAYMHSFFLTEHFVVVCVPSTHYVAGGIKQLWVGNLIDAIEPFDEGKLCRWFIVDRQGRNGVVAEFTSPAGFFFHSVNAWEEAAQTDGDSGKVAPEAAAVDIFCDMVWYPDLEIMQSYYYDILMKQDGAATAFWTEDHIKVCTPLLTRLRFPVTRSTSASPPATEGKAQLQQAERVLSISGPHVGELPIINSAYKCKKHRYVYSLAQRGFSTIGDTIVKTDTLTREALMWDTPHGHSPGEAVFVARPRPEGGERLAEDDGVLLSMVLDGHKGTSYLLCLDARTMTELGRAEADFAMGIGFHGVHTTGH